MGNFTLVKNQKIYITTESSSAGINLATPGLYSTTPGNIYKGTGIGKRGDVPLDGLNEPINFIPGVIAYEPNFDREVEEVELFDGIGKVTPVPLRKAGSITLNLKKQSDVFARLDSEAPVGVKASGLEAMDNDYTSNNPLFGYRIYIYDGSWTVMYHCTVESYSSAPGQDKHTARPETITFSFNDYKVDVAEGDLSNAEGVQ